MIATGHCLQNAGFVVPFSTQVLQYYHWLHYSLFFLNIWEREGGGRLHSQHVR